MHGYPPRVGTPQSLEAAVVPQEQGEEQQQHDDNQSFHCGTPFGGLRRAGRRVINAPAYNKSTCFDAFLFSAATEEQKARIREIGERLDAHRKARQALHPKLTMTDMYAVLEQVRYGVHLTAKEQRISEQADILTLKALHGELDAAVAVAYHHAKRLSIFGASRIKPNKITVATTYHLESIMFSKNRWDGHVVDIEFDDANGRFGGTIRNIPDRRVSFWGRDYVELKNAYIDAIQKYANNPEQFPEKNKKEKAIANYTYRSQFRNIFSSEELAALQDFIFKNKSKSNETSIHANPRHPLYALIKAYERNETFDENRITVACNTERCLELIQRVQPKFLDSIKNRLQDCSDYTQSSSALAELRAFGTLCFTGLTPEAVHDSSEKTADFKLSVGKAQCLIEVHTKFSTPDDERQLSIEDTLGEQNENVRVVRLSNITPFGQPDVSKPDDGVSTNMISKICAMKQKETQFIDNSINILWIDLQDTEVLCFPLNADHCLPYFTDTRPTIAPYTGCIWHAFYGKNHDNVIENHSGCSFELHKMRHDGRFEKKNKNKFCSNKPPRCTCSL